MAAGQSRWQEVRFGRDDFKVEPAGVLLEAGGKEVEMKSGSGNRGLDWFIIFGMIAAYPKTADLLSLFSPQILNDIVGFDMSLVYGLFCALMIEGTILFLHFDRRAHRSSTAQSVKWVLIGVSFLCQVFDGIVTTDAVSQMSPVLRFILTYGVPALPLIVATMIAAIGVLPDDNEVVVHKGWKHRLPNFNRLWNGDENTVVSPGEVVQANLLDEVELPKSPNGREKEVANPTIRQP